MASATMSTIPRPPLSASSEASGSMSNAQVPHDSITLQPWNPDPSILLTITQLLSHSTTTHTAVHERLFAEMRSHAQNRYFPNYLVYILTNGSAVAQIMNIDVTSDHSITVRQAAGLMLKSSLCVLGQNIHPQVILHLQASLVDAMGDNAKILREVVASCISTLVMYNQATFAYSGIVTSLTIALDSQNPSLLDGALVTISRLAEDVPSLFIQDPSKSLDRLLPKIIHLCCHQSHQLQVRSLNILNHLIMVMPPSLQENVDTLCKTLFSIAEESVPEVRKHVCTAICLVFNAAPLALAPYINSVIEYMLQSSSHPDEQVAKEATEFWALFSNSEQAANALLPFLPRLVPMLLTNMVYSADEMATLDASASPDDMIPDKPEDIRPRFVAPRLIQNFSGRNGPTSDSADDGGEDQMNSPMLTSLPPPNGYGNHSDCRMPFTGLDLGESVHQRTNGYHKKPDCDDLTDSDDEDEDYDPGSDEVEWNLRRCSASTLDALACVFGDKLLDVLLPCLQEKLTNSARWEQRESAVLALGAIAEGCRSGMDMHLRTLFPFLLVCASDEHYMVRCIGTWTMSRYSRWIIEQREDSTLQQLLGVLLELMLDRNKVVQKASCSALASLVEEAGMAISTYISPILEAVTVASEKYQQSNLIMLFDIICALADSVESKIANAEHRNLIMHFLLSQWKNTADDDVKLFPLLECLGVMFRAIGKHSSHYADAMFTRCVDVMAVVYSNERKMQKNDSSVELLISSLDLMWCLAEALGPNVEPYVAKSGDGAKPMLPFLFLALKDERQEVRQSAFALLGELARARAPSLLPAFPDFIRYTIAAIDPGFMSVSNNATWALGELVMMAGTLPRNVPIDRDTIQRILLEHAADALIRIVNMPQLSKSLRENSAITLGRLGLVTPEPMAAKLESFAQAVLVLLRNIRDDVDKEQAFHGINSMIRLRPTEILECFVYYVDAIASWFKCTRELEIEFASILGSYKVTFGDVWVKLYNDMPTYLQKVLSERFRL